MEENRKENVAGISTPAMRITSTPQPALWDRSGSFALGTSATPSTLDRSNLRPLTQSYKGAQADYEVRFVICFHQFVRIQHWFLLI